MMSENRSSPEVEISKKDSLGPITKRALKAIVWGALGRDESEVLISPHCAGHMRGREFSTSDVVYVLETGDYSEFKHRWDDLYKNWVYAVSGEDLDGKRLKVVFSIEDCGSKIRVISAQRFSGGKQV